MVSDSSGESTQGAGAVAMLVSQNPRILELTDDNVAINQMSWTGVQNYSSAPYVQGIYSAAIPDSLGRQLG